MKLPRYPAYKAVDIPWIGEAPSHWGLTPLLGVASERAESNAGFLEDNLLSLSYGEIIRKEIGSNDGLLPESFETYQIIHEGDIVLRLTDLQNDKRSLRSARAMERGIITSAYLALRPERIDSAFLAHLLRAMDQSKVFYSMGGGLRQSMKYADLKRMPILIPPQGEQAAIAAFLDRETAKIDALIAEQERLLGLLAEKRQAVISHAVTKGLNSDASMKDSGVAWLGEVPAHWEVRSLRTLSTVVRGASPRPAGDPQFFNGDYIPWVTVAEITKDSLIDLTKTEGWLTEDGAANSRVFRAGTVIYSNSGATLGVPKILRVDACANDGVVGFENLSDLVDPTFLYHYLSSLTETIRDMVKQGSGQPNLNTGLVKALPISLPNRQEQLEICARIRVLTEKFHDLSSDVLGAIALLRERRTALIAAAVTGQIDVREAA